MEDRILRRHEVFAPHGCTGITERQGRNLEDEGKFPKRFLIAEGGRAVGWSMLEIQEWLRRRKEAREAPDHPGIAQRGQRIAAA
jgi:predicted DNA-binding transcriptional regulator AlpA